MGTLRLYSRVQKHFIFSKCAKCTQLQIHDNANAVCAAAVTWSRFYSSFRTFLKLSTESSCISAQHERQRHNGSSVGSVNNAPSRTIGSNNKRVEQFKFELQRGPNFKSFLSQESDSGLAVHTDKETVPYINQDLYTGIGRKVYFETFGCQMNVNDTEIAWSILKEKGFQKTIDIKEADVILVMTCAIREGAEQKIWRRLVHLKGIKRARSNKSAIPVKIGILGCMAERLKQKILEREKMVDLVCGPDAYRDLPRMLSLTGTGQTAVNVLLSMDETYADVLPVRLSQNAKSAFVSIMRGCDNMCTYCIVPFTRGRERSRPISSILQEVKTLSEQGIKEVTLLGQNVNSYRDMSESHYYGGTSKDTVTNLAAGFSTVYKPKTGGRRFSDLLDYVSRVDPEMRIRFTSPHPKDFPDEVLELISERANICTQLHLPAQSGSSAVLERMRRGYTREAYLDLVTHVRNIIPGVALSSDFIAGFCGETEEDHMLTVSMMKQVKYNFAFCFPYSMREKTKAYHRLSDDVDPVDKSRRHLELQATFREEALRVNQGQVGQIQLVLVEGESKRSPDDLAARNDANTKVIFPKQKLENGTQIKAGDYVAVKITDATSQVLKGIPLYHTSLQEFTGREQYLDLQENVVYS